MTELSTSTPGVSLELSMFSPSTDITPFYYDAGTGSDASALFDGDTSETGGNYMVDGGVGDHIFSLTTTTLLDDITIYTHRPKYFPGFRIDLNGTTLVTDGGNGGSADTPSPFIFLMYNK